MHGEQWIISALPMGPSTALTPDTLADWMEGGLTPGHLAHHQSHLANSVRCHLLSHQPLGSSRVTKAVVVQCTVQTSNFSNQTGLGVQMTVTLHIGS